jgi:hypothetical protein
MATVSTMLLCVSAAEGSPFYVTFDAHFDRMVDRSTGRVISVDEEFFVTAMLDVDEPPINDSQTGSFGIGPIATSRTADTNGPLPDDFPTTVRRYGRLSGNTLILADIESGSGEGQRYESFRAIVISLPGTFTDVMALLSAAATAENPRIDIADSTS